MTTDGGDSEKKPDEGNRLWRNARKHGDIN
jgi:hypothetical protein